MGNKIDNKIENSVPKKGLLIVVSGFSGSGKGTVLKELCEKHDNFAFSVSVTTRDRRQNEVEGKDYFYISEDEFEKMRQSGMLLESAGFVGHHYGTPKAYVEEKRLEGKDVILEIETVGAMQVRSTAPDAILIFITPPDFEEIENRLIKRKREEKPEIDRRMKKATKEVLKLPAYDYILVNDNDKAPECAERIFQIVENERLRARRQNSFLMKLEEEADVYRQKFWPES